MNRINEPGWIRIGIMCNAGRRSVWTRDVRVDNGDESELIAIELCSGREGDDWYVKVTRAHPAWSVVYEITSMLTWIVETNASDDAHDEARLPSHIPPDPKVKGETSNEDDTAVDLPQPWTKHGVTWFGGPT